MTVHRSRPAPSLLLLLLLLLGPALASAEGLFDTCARKAAEGEGLAVSGEPGWYFSRNELLHLAAGPFWGEHAEKANAALKPGQRDPLAAIVNYKERLAAAGIELLFVPIPAKAVVYPDRLDAALPAPAPRPDTHHQAFYAALRAAGVNVLDMTPTLIAEREGEPVYCRTDAHYSPKGAQLVATAIAGVVRSNSWYRAPATNPFKAEARELTVTGDLRQGTPGATPETLQATVVTLGDGQSVPDDSAESPVLLLTDSHGLVFHSGDDMLAKGAGLVDLLAIELRAPLDLMGKRGSAATPVRLDVYRKAKGDPDWLSRKKLVVWLLTVREFTGSSWSTKIPVKPAS